MTIEPTTVMIFCDDAGAYYLVPLAVVEGGRVPAAVVPDLEAAMGVEAGRDSAGYLRRKGGGVSPIGQIKAQLESAGADSDSQNALNNFSIQGLTSDFVRFTGFTAFSSRTWP